MVNDIPESPPKNNEGEPAPPQELVRGVFLVARHPGHTIVGVGTGVHALSRTDQEVAAADCVGRHGHHQVDIVGLDPRRRPLSGYGGRGSRVAEQVELPGPLPIRGHGDHHQDDRASHAHSRTSCRTAHMTQPPHEPHYRPNGDLERVEDASTSTATVRACRALKQRGFAAGQPLPSVTPAR